MYLQALRAPLFTGGGAKALHGEDRRSRRLADPVVDPGEFATLEVFVAQVGQERVDGVEDDQAGVHLFLDRREARQQSRQIEGPVDDRVERHPRLEQVKVRRTAQRAAPVEGGDVAQDSICRLLEGDEDAGFPGGQLCGHRLHGEDGLPRAALADDDGEPVAGQAAARDRIEASDPRRLLDDRRRLDGRQGWFEI
jgi:hypothetical protein